MRGSVFPIVFKICISPAFDQKALNNMGYRKFNQYFRASIFQRRRKTRPSKMEIYHRDNWIMIVHMAPWYHLTQGTEENTAIDWTSHIGRIVKRVLPVTPAFTPLALRLWLHKIYFHASEPRVPWRGAHQIHLVNLGYY